MPWSKMDGSEVEGCDDDQIAVVKDEDGELEGCHDSDEEADDQIAALEASEDDRADSEEGDDEAEGDEAADERAQDADELGGAAEDAGHGMQKGEAGVREYEGRSYTSIIKGAEIRETADDKVTVKVMTDEIARDGMVVDPEGLRTENYMKYGSVLWEHGQDPRRGFEPVATTVNMIPKPDGYIAELQFVEDEDDQFARRIERKVRNDEIRAVSLGWRTETVKREKRNGEMVPVVKEADMTEFSFVGVPSDVNALVQSRMHYPDEAAPNERSTFLCVCKGLIELEAARRSMNGQTHAQALEGVKDDIESNVMGGVMEVKGPGCPFEDMPSPTDGFESLASVLNVEADTLMQAAAVDGCSYDRSALDDEGAEDNDERSNEDEDSRDCGCGNEGTPSSPSAQDGTPSDAERDEPPGIDELIDLSQRIGPSKVRQMADAIGTEDLARLVAEHGAETIAQERKRRAQIKAGKQMGVL